MKAPIWTVFTLVLALAPIASAATITFSPGVDFGNVNQLATTGALVEARNLGNLTVNVTTTNGITFAAGNSDSLAIQNETKFADGNLYIPATHKVGYTSIVGLTGAQAENLFDTLEFGSGAGSWNATWQNLVVGRTYAFDLLFSDDRNATSVIYVSNTSGGFAGPYDMSRNAVQLVTGTFTADATTQGLRIAVGGANNVQLNAYQLRDLTVVIPAPAALPAGVALLALAAVRRRG